MRPLITDPTPLLVIPSHITGVLAQAGAGKSALAAQVAYLHAQRGRHVLIATNDQPDAWSDRIQKAAHHAAGFPIRVSMDTVRRIHFAINPTVAGVVDAHGSLIRELGVPADVLLVVDLDQQGTAGQICEWARDRHITTLATAAIRIEQAAKLATANVVRGSDTHWLARMATLTWLLLGDGWPGQPNVGQALLPVGGGVQVTIR